jgi:SRSO17 transposase
MNKSRKIEIEIEEIKKWSEGLEKIAEKIQSHFATTLTFKRAIQYLKGLLSHCERKNGWQLSEITGDKTPYALQNLMNRVNWDTDAVRDDLQAYVSEHFGEDEGIFIVDETGFIKKGTKSAGVQRQYSGTAGRIENSQIGVFLAYKTSKGHTLIDRELYLPKSWIEDRKRCNEAGIPKETSFQTKPQLAKKMFKNAFGNNIKAKWVTGDEVYGNNGELRNWLESKQHPYVLAVACDTYVWKEFEHLRVDALVKTLTGKDWKRLSAGEGSKGHRWYDWAVIEINSMLEPEQKRCVLFRRNTEDPSEIAYYLVFSPVATTLEEMVHVAGSRWAIEICFESAKNEVGLDQYEVRKWQGWYHHITLCMFAHALLTVICTQTNTGSAKKGGTLVKMSSMKQFREKRKILSR